MKDKVKKFRILGIFALLLTVSVGCSENVSTDNQNNSDQTSTNPDSIELPLSDGVTANGVLLAAYLITSGDIALAVEQALVSPDEVELARKAIDDGTLQEWVDLASTK